MLGRVVAVHLVDDLGVRLQRTEAVRKAFRHEQLVALGRAQHHGDMPAVTRRARADINRDIEDRAGRGPHQRGLRHRRGLEMQAANDAAIDR